MKNIFESLEFLYPTEDAIALHAFIEKKINELNAQEKSETKKKFDQEDIFLISYADSVYEENKPSLKSLQAFSYKTSDFINNIHLLPFYPSSSDGGFSVVDYKKVASHCGQWDELQGFKENLMFDAVFNHISAKSQWFQGWLNNEEKYENYFIHFDETTVHSQEFEEKISRVTRPRTTPVLTPFERKDGQTRYVWTTFSNDQIDLNFHNPQVLKEVIDTLFFYFENGAKTIRIDAIPYYWKELGKSCAHHPKTMEIVKLFRAITNKISNPRFLITESNVPHEENIRYWGKGDMAHMVYNFSLPPLVVSSFLFQDAQKISQWSQSIHMEGLGSFFNINATHDGIGLRPLEGLLSDQEINELVKDANKKGGVINYRTSRNGESRPYELNITWTSIIYDKLYSEEQNINRLITSHLILASFPGVPAYYIHSLLTNFNDNEKRAKTQINRDINRTIFKLSQAFSKIENDPLTKSVFSRLEKALITRKSQKAFHPEAKKSDLNLDRRVWAFTRSYQGETILALFNFSKDSIKLKVSPGLELLSNKRVKDEITLDSFVTCWIKLD